MFQGYIWGLIPSETAVFRHFYDVRRIWSGRWDFDPKTVLATRRRGPQAILSLAMSTPAIAPLLAQSGHLDQVNAYGPCRDQAQGRGSRCVQVATTFRSTLG